MTIRKTNRIQPEGLTMDGDLLAGTDSLHTLGSATSRFLGIHLDGFFLDPACHNTALKVASYTIVAGEIFLHVGANSSADTKITLPNAATAANLGRVVVLSVEDSVDTHHVQIASAGGKVGTTASPAGSGGEAAATGVQTAIDGSVSAWIANGTDWDLIWDGAGDWVAQS